MGTLTGAQQHTQLSAEIRGRRKKIVSRLQGELAVLVVVFLVAALVGFV